MGPAAPDLTDIFDMDISRLLRYGCAPTREFVSHWASFHVLLVHSMLNILFILYVISLSFFWFT